MGSVASIVPVLQAAGSVVSAFGGLGGGKEKSAAPPPPLPSEPTPEPEGVADQDVARMRALKRRKEASKKGGLLSLDEDQDKSLTNFLLGE